MTLRAPFRHSRQRRRLNSLVLKLRALGLRLGVPGLVDKKPRPAPFYLRARNSGPAEAALWTLATCHGTSIFYDPSARLCMHGETPQEGWRPVYLWTSDYVHGLLLPDCADAADHVRPVRIRFYQETRCTLLGAKCGRAERLFSARPVGFEMPWAYVEWVEQVSPWEVVTPHKAPKRSGIHEKALREFAKLVAEQPSAADIVNRPVDGQALRWFLAFRDAPYLSTLGYEAVRQPGQQFIRRLKTSATRAAFRQAYESLADWIENRDVCKPIDHLGLDFDLFEPWPGHGPFSIDSEILVRMRKHIEPRKGACVLASLRDEGPYIVEWLAYHQSLGFEHFFIYTNDSADGSEELLAALAGQGHVTLITNDARNVRPQYKAYGHAFQALPHILDYEWALVIDGDEFLVLAPERGFSDIKRYTDWICTRPVDAIAFNWVVFRAFGVDDADLEAPVTRRFVRRSTAVDQHIKSMVKPRLFSHAHAHHGFETVARPHRFLNANGDRYLHKAEKAHGVFPVADTAWINHYWTKSVAELRGKLARKTGDMHGGYVRPIWEVEALLETLQREEAAETWVEDRRIWPWLSAAEANGAALLADPRLRTAHETSVARQSQRLEELVNAIAADREGRVVPRYATLPTTEKAAE